MQWVKGLHGRVFGPGRFARTAFRVRERLPVDPGLCLIAMDGDRRVGSVWMTPVCIGGEGGCLLGPLAIDTDYRNRGLGRMLVRTATRMALAMECHGFVVLVGDEEYYGSMGFKRARPGSIIFPGPVDPERVLVCFGEEGHIEGLAGSIV